jgi:hypothetical protein
MKKPSARRHSALRLVSLALLSALVVVLTGDRGVTAVPSGIDPLEVLNLQVRANAIVVLDSSGSMREMTDGPGATSPAAGEVAGDDPTAKLAQAKSVLRSVITANETKVSFQFGRYEQDAASYGPEGANRFLYTKTCLNTDAACTAAANAIAVDCGIGSAACGIGLFKQANATFRRTVGTTTTYHLFANRFYNGQNIRVRTTGASGTIFSTSAPGITPVSGVNPPYVFVQNITSTGALTGSNVKFDFKGIRWNKANANASCGGFHSLVGLAACTDNMQIDDIGPHLDPELDLTTVPGTIAGYANQAPGTFGNGTPAQPPMRGIRASGFTPIAESLIDIKGIFNTLWGGSIAGLNPKPRTFVIFVTDGDDTCSSSAGPGSLSTTELALRAAHKAQQLYARVDAAEPASSVTTFTVVFGTGVAVDQANWIAWGGSGMTGIPTTGGGAAQRWSRAPTPAERAACTTCRDAFVAANATDLNNALQTAIDQGQSAGEFSDQQSITESIFELGPISGVDPLDPALRYSVTLPALLQSTFEMPDFKGHLNAFRNQAGTSFQMWDAGQALTDRVTNSLGSLAHTFVTLRGGAASTPTTIPTAGPGAIRRRIYTTNRNGVFLTGSDVAIVNNLTTANFVPPGQIALWPPDATVDPAPGGSGYPAGVLDDELGFMGLTFAQLQTEFAACTSLVAGDLPGDCSVTTGSPARQLQLARREARQTILAHAAGADLVKNGLVAVRVPGTRELQYQKRAWVLAESTLAAPAVVTPPLQGTPATHAPEYALFRDGPRTASDIATDGLALGFGLRNPDKDATSLASPGADSRTTLKPVMSVVYHGANDMLHAFRAGPQPFTDPCVPSPTLECGGEELWTFVPYDQLGKLRERIKTQQRDPHTYVIASPVRVSDVFVPGAFSRTIGGVTVSGDGVWRTVILFGRGIAGKYYTAIDITAPGPFTRASLLSAPPIVMWSRGNPDRQDGTPTGALNNNAADATAYLKMGQTWSVPTIGSVTAANNTTARRPQGIEFVSYVGSGYGSGASAASEGSTIFALDTLTGDVIAAVDVGDRAGMPFENAVVASPAGFNAEQLRPGFVTNPGASKTSRIYVGDIHGRVWRLLTDSPGAAPQLFADLGSNQPVANAVALVHYAGTLSTSRPHVFVESGNDNRITPPPAATPPFRLYGLRDDDGASGTLLFTIDLPDGFRGNVQPATAFNDATPPAARVFFAGTRFNLPGSANAPAPPPCRSSFDSILAAVGAETGNAAYDLNASGDDRFVQITNQRIQAVRVAGGRLVIDTGLGAQVAPPPPAPPTTQPPAPSLFANVSVGAFNTDGTPRIVGLVPYKMGSSVCR